MQTRTAIFASCALAGGLTLATGTLLWLDQQVEARFRGPIFEQASRIYASAPRLRPGSDLERMDLAGHLERIGYRSVAEADVEPGAFYAGRRTFTIGLRPFRSDPGGRVTAHLDFQGRVRELRDAEDRPLSVVRIEPALIGALRPGSWQSREIVPLDAIPQRVVDAFLAIEDHRFYEHHGLDLRRAGAALIENLRAGRVVQGGSTLTQQLAKNLYLTRERTLWRKLQEAAIALSLEWNLTKDQILEAYLNEIYLGQSGDVAIHGVVRGAGHFFSKPLAALDVGEAALLAGLVRGPSLYSPFRNPEGAKERRDLVLARMREAGHLDDVAYAAAVAAPLGLHPHRTPMRPAPYFVDSLREKFASGDDSEVLTRSGLSVFTTLDLRLQGLAERAVRRGLTRLERGMPSLIREDEVLQAALVALDPATGGILAHVGGRDYAVSQFDRATEARRQPGSAFKPVVALAALLREDPDAPPFTLASVLVDEPLSVPGLDGDWEPSNYDLEFRGEVTLRQALEESLNVPIARLGQEVGLRRIVATARRLGFTSRLRAVPSLALGAFEVTLLELTRAYAVLASGGTRTVPRSVRSVIDAEGNVLVAPPVEAESVFEPAETYLVTSALEGAVERGTGRGLRAHGYRGAVAGKTGTTNDYRDAWFIGYTPELAVGVWVGYDDGASLELTGAGAALPIFAEFLIGALGPEGGAVFPYPDGLEEMRVVARAGFPAGLRCDGASEVFLAGTGPESSCRRGGIGAFFDFFRFGSSNDRPTVSAGPPR